MQKIIEAVKNIIAENPDQFAELAYWMLTDSKVGAVKKFHPGTKEREALWRLALSYQQQKVDSQAVEVKNADGSSKRKTIVLEGFQDEGV